MTIIKVGDKIEEHDKEVEKLKDSLKEFADEIKSLPDFRNNVSEKEKRLQSARLRLTGDAKICLNVKVVLKKI